MRELVLVRHAKSSWDYDVDDRNRPLNERGIRNIISIAHSNRSIFQEAEAIFTSPANRAFHTAIILAYECKIAFSLFHIEESLYDFQGDSVLSFISAMDNSFKSVIIVGHNPTFTYLINRLSNKKIDHLPTAAFAKIVFESDNWQNIGKGVLVEMKSPKDIIR